MIRNGDFFLQVARNTNQKDADTRKGTPASHKNLSVPWAPLAVCQSLTSFPLQHELLSVITNQYRTWVGGACCARVIFQRGLEQQSPCSRAGLTHLEHVLILHACDIASIVLLLFAFFATAATADSANLSYMCSFLSAAEDNGQRVIVFHSTKFTAFYCCHSSIFRNKQHRMQRSYTCRGQKGGKTTSTAKSTTSTHYLPRLSGCRLNGQIELCYEVGHL